MGSRTITLGDNTDLIVVHTALDTELQLLAKHIHRNKLLIVTDLELPVVPSIFRMSGPARVETKNCSEVTSIEVAVEAAAFASRFMLILNAIWHVYHVMMIIIGRIASGRNIWRTVWLKGSCEFARKV